MNIEKTLEQYESVTQQAFDLFSKKTKDYGTSWRILRPKSLTDQIFIKVQRLRSVQEAGTQKVNDSLEGEFIGALNYSIMALIQFRSENKTLPLELSPDLAKELYSTEMKKIKDLMIAKNHDYGEAWRDMRISSFVDLMLQKLLRIKSIEDNNGKTLISEGIDAGYQDIVNYSIFALIKISEESDPMK